MRLYICVLLAAFTSRTISTQLLFEPKKTGKVEHKANFYSKLLEKARPTQSNQLHRSLDQYVVELSKYELKFQRCQFVSGYDDELAEDEQAQTVLSTKRFIIFRLCPAGTCGSCNANFGEYIVDMDTYFELATQYFVEAREGQCKLCEEICYNADDDSLKNRGIVDCYECVSYCAMIEAMDQKGYVESYEFAQCVQIWNGDDDSQIFAGAMCSDGGYAIKIGAFQDEECSTPLKDVNVERYMENGMRFNDDILEKMVDVDNCVSCIQNRYEVPDDDKWDDRWGWDDAMEVNEMCEQLYEMSAKCESQYGFDNYWKYYEEYENQYYQEDIVCDFIKSIKNNNYDEYGEIILSGSDYFTDAVSAKKGEKVALTFFILGSVALGVYAATLHSQLTKGAKADLSAQGGAMA